MSATLGVLLHELEPRWPMMMAERLDSAAAESSNGWNNAGTSGRAPCPNRSRDNGTPGQHLCVAAFAAPPDSRPLNQ